MTNKSIIVKNREDIPQDWEVIKTRKKTTVRIRPSSMPEEFTVSWSDSILKSDPTVDLIVIQPNGKEYPCKKDLFFNTYVPHLSSGEFIKRATTEIVRIPKGIDITVLTLEGQIGPVSYPDFIAIGSGGELYANTATFVEENLVFL